MSRISGLFCSSKSFTTYCVTLYFSATISFPLLSYLKKVVPVVKINTIDPISFFAPIQFHYFCVLIY